MAASGWAACKAVGTVGKLTLPEQNDQAPPSIASDAAETPARGDSCVLTINAGSSSLKFALFAPGEPPLRQLTGAVERVGQEHTVLVARPSDGAASVSWPIEARDHVQAAKELIDWLRHNTTQPALLGIGHRVVHGGMRVVDHQLITASLLSELHAAQPLDLAHLPRQIALIEAFASSFPELPQVACFDTAFHRDMPRVAKLLPIPRRYDEMGVRRLGFHGLSYTYLMDELRRVAGAHVTDNAANNAADGRVILAHLGSGASMAAVRGGKPIDTTMAFTPTAGLIMGTRPGDLDPGLLVYLMRAERLTTEQMDEFINRRCGLIGVSETSSDMRDLIARRAADVRAAEAVDLFCYQARKWIGAFTAALGGLDTLVFAGGIGENSPQVRAEICQGLEYLGLRIDPALNAAGAPVISPEGTRVSVRVIRTDEEMVIARIVYHLIQH